jgi:RNA recognition motif-containing protein
LRNLSNDITEEDIYNVMYKFGEIVKVKIPMEEGARKPRNRGYAFVTFKSIDSAERALE